ncbi:MAG TPA: nitroreductase family protein [Spirochaetota bacterium]|nr:nitroreductase family protein [Spirochaetota bacterium]
MKKRRSVRLFSKRPVPEEVVLHCISVAASAPSGANLQPWHFVVVRDPAVKKQIRTMAEEIEEGFYRKKSTRNWRDRLKPIGTGPGKPFLEQAPYLVCIFVHPYSIDEDGTKSPNYYASESVGIATGFLISALHRLGLSTLPYTPAPMHFLKKLLDRPENERPFMILAVGYRDEGYEPPVLVKKNKDEYLTVI